MSRNLVVGVTIPSSWKVVQLEDVAFFQEGPGLRKWQWTDSGMKVINVTNLIGDGQIDINNTSRFISLNEFNQKYRHFAVRARDVVVASSGNTYGKVGRITAEDLPVMMNTSVIRFHSADLTSLDDDFLYSFLRSEIFRNQVESFVTGSAQPNFGPSHLKQMFIPLPPLPVQRRIAGVLSAYDDLIENCRRRIRILELMARALYREWFVHFRFPGRDEVGRVDSPLGEIPEGWEVKAIDDVCERVTDGSHYSPKSIDEGLPMASSKDMHDWGLNLETCRQIGSKDFADLVKNDCKPKRNDVLITKDGANYLKRIFVTRAEQEVVLLSSVAILRPNEKINPHLLAAILKEPENRERLKNYVTGAPIPRVILKDFKRFEILLPSNEIQTRWSRIAEPMTLQIWGFIDQIQNLRRTRDLLLPRLLSGQIPLDLN